MAISGTSTSTLRSSWMIPGGVVPSWSERCDASWIVGPSITGIGERDAHLDRVGPSRDHGPQHVHPIRAETSGDVGHQQLSTSVPAGAAAPSPRPRRLTLIVSRPITCSASLSPRPDMVTSTLEPCGSSPLSQARSTQATACAGSKAGMMPSRAGQPLQGVEHLARRPPARSGPDRCWPGRRARGRHPGSPGRPRWSGPPRPVRTRPAAGRTSCRGRPLGLRVRWRRRPPLRLRRAGPRCRQSRRRCPAALDPPPTQATT